MCQTSSFPGYTSRSDLQVIPDLTERDATVRADRGAACVPNLFAGFNHQCLSARAGDARRPGPAVALGAHLSARASSCSGTCRGSPVFQVGAAAHSAGGNPWHCVPLASTFACVLCVFTLFLRIIQMCFPVCAAYGPRAPDARRAVACLPCSPFACVYMQFSWGSL
jgi:hypothetical protein